MTDYSMDREKETFDAPLGPNAQEGNSEIVPGQPLNHINYHYDVTRDAVVAWRTAPSTTSIS